MLGLLLFVPVNSVLAATCSDDPSTLNVVSHDLSGSYCELCGSGPIRIVLTNEADQPLTNVTVVENLRSSGLEYVPGTTTINGVATGDPVITGGSNQILTWTSTEISQLASLAARINPTTPRTYVIEFQVRRPSGTEEGLASTTLDRSIQASASFDYAECPPNPLPNPPWPRTTDTTGLDVLPLREPVPTITKLGRNVDAAQTGYTATVYGNTDDDVIWQVTVANAGLADMQDVIFRDIMTQNSGQNHLTYACPTQAAAEQIAITNNGSGPGTMGCVAIVNNTIDPFAKNNFFGNPNAVDVTAGGNASVYLVGKILGSCTNQTNTADNLQWGCQTGSIPDGGITQTSNGVTPAGSSINLSTVVNSGGLTITRQFRGSDLGPNVGTKGTITITITNNSGGTIKNLDLDDVLPSTHYVADPTYTPTLTVTHQGAVGNGNYLGIIDTVNWTNQDTGNLLNNGSPHFLLESSTTHPDAGSNLLRNGDVLTLNFRIVLINSNFYDKQANLDEPNEAAGVDDPAPIGPLANQLTVNYDEFCSGAATPLVFNDNFTPSPEDIDVSLDAPIYILTNDPTQLLSMTVTLTNRGGHSAADHYSYVSFGETIEVVNAPGACTRVSYLQTPTNLPRPLWDLPAPVPDRATVYECTSGVIGRNGGTRNYTFQVRKVTDTDPEYTARIDADDLTFRADVIGEIHLSDGTALTTPPPSDTIGSTVNNYTLDGIRARVIGYNLTKSEVGNCSENVAAALSPDTNVQIGEECTYQVRTGGWFGFKTPGFTYIAVQNIQVNDNLPNGQGYISSTDPSLTSDMANHSAVPEVTGVEGIALNPAGLAAPDEGTVYWTFNQVTPAERIKEKDKWFQANITTRLLNDPVDTRASPNVHAATSSNILDSTFEAVFNNASTGLDEIYTITPSTVGYPQISVRRVDLTVTEPNIQVTKEVCNETLHGIGPGCSTWETLTQDGDTNDSYIYRITLTNTQPGSVPAAPAYDVTTNDTLDSSDMMKVVDLNSDGIDNDGDGMIDGADTDGEGKIGDNTLENGTPATVVFSHTYSSALKKINEGVANQVRLYYRVDPGDMIAPEQELTNTVTASYDSLEGDYGNMSAPLRANGDIAGARQYTSSAAQATVKIIPVLTQPKQITATSSTTLGGPPQALSIGEEVRYELTTEIPVSELRNLVIRDVLPAGMTCVEAPAIDLSPFGPHASAGFRDGNGNPIVTPVIPTCTSTGTNDYVEWNFGNVSITTATGTRYSLPVTFIARVLNISSNSDGVSLNNGAAPSTATVSYEDEAGVSHSGSYASVGATVREPHITLTKSFSAASADAGDVLTVTVTATNDGNATAYNLRVLDNLVGTKMTFLNSVSGTDPPDNIDTTTLGANQPIFSWNSFNPDYAIAPGETKSFTFTVSVDANVEPGEILSNTIQASWQSLRDQSTSLNSSGLIGVDGSAMGMRNGSLPIITGDVNDYESTATATIPVQTATINKLRISDTYDATPNVRIGDTVTYELRLNLPEATISNVVLNDTLPQGLRFERVVSVNGDTTSPYSSVAPFTYTDIGAPTVTGDPTTGPTTVNWNLGQIVNAGDNNSSNNTFVIRYEAIVLSGVLPQANNTPLTNTVTLDYTLGGTPVPQQSDSETINVIQPDLVMTKTGPAGVQFGYTSTFTLNLQNTGTSTAWDTTVTDRLPNLDPAAGGMCDTPPSGFTAGIYTSGGTPVTTLTQGTDYDVNWSPAPTCELTFTMKSTAAAIASTQRLIITYQAMPDNDNAGGVSLTNVAGATEWFSQDTAGTGATGQIETYTRSLTNGTPTITDHEDAHTVVTEIPALNFEKTVSNVTTSGSGSSASPGDQLHYTITVTNGSSFDLAAFRLTDEVDRLSGGNAYFEPNSLSNIVVTGGGTPDTSGSDPAGGSQGTGLLDVQNLTLAAGASVTIEFDIRLASSIPNGTVVQNQAQILIPNYVTLDSDNPATATADDPTPTTISSAPLLQVEKVSQDLTGDPAILDAGDTLRYTITVKNIGNEDMNNVSLRDQIPANTTYVANSTTLNGAAVADPSAGVSALESGMSINAPENTTAGYMRADATATTSNVATITFDVVVNSSAVNGTVISNQGFVNGDGIGSGAFPETPSDDPGTATANDPTVDIVGSLPLIDAQKTVALTNDADGNLQVSSGDTLTYTITISNNGAVDATGVVFTDTMPTNVTYVAGSGRLNGATTGINFSGTTLTADYAGAIGNFARGTTATITFDVTVNGTVSNGDIISNQGTVSSNEQADEPTDADGNDANGDQPTLISVGAGQALSINKSVAVVGGGVALAGGQLEYTVQVANIGTTTATSVVIRDNMVAGQFAYVPGSGTLNGSTTGVSYAPTTLTANVGSLAAGASATLRFRVTLDSSLVTGTTVTNTGFVDWDTPTQTNNASVSIDIGGIPGFANLNGSVWHDANFDNTQDAGERPLQNWSVDIYRNSTLLDTVTTDANGAYQINGLAPNAGTADSYSLQFRAPGSTPTSAKLGLADSAFTNGLQSITDIIVGSGSNAQNLNLPIDPDGVIYDSVARTPIAGATVTMQEAGTGTPLPTSCFDDPNQQNQVTLADGYYKFDLNTTCAGSGDYLISVAPPASGYTGTESLVIPASSNATTAAYSVPVCAAASPSGFCTAQTQETAPSVSDATTYYLHVAVNTTTVPNNSQLFNNHIPLDPIITGTGVTLTKTAGKVNVMRGDLVPYTIVATNNLVGALSNNDIIDTMPPGFKYVAGSAKLNNVATEPTVNGRELRWSGVALNPGTPVTIKLLLIVGGGVGEGEYVNQAVVYNNILATNASSVATATVRVVPDPMTDCSDVIGRVFDDRNGNGYQDAGEPGVAGARVATVNGLLTTTDKHGRYHIACAAVPSRERGSNFILKLDTHSLPSGYRVTTENPRVQRLTRGQMAKINFGVALQRVVRLDLSNAAFKPVRDELRPEWLQSIDQVIDQLKEGPSVLRISYLGDAETASMVNARIKNVRSMIGDKWKALNPKYDLAVETEVFWRRGNPGSGGGGTPSKDGIAFSKLNGSAYYSDIGENTESLLPDAELTVWARDKSFHLDDNDPVYFKTRTIEQVENSNEQNLPSVSTDGGEPMVSKESITRVRQIIQRAGSDKRVRLQFIGYTDDRPLSDAEKKEYGDSITMSVEQARMVAEYYRRELNLNANQVSVEGRGASKPLNKRGLSNRRVDVRLFVEQVNQQQVEEPLVVPRPGTKELRVCRVESACITVRKKKDARKIVVNNLIEPIRFTQESDRVAPEVLAKLKAAFARYSDKPDIQLHFTGHVDSGGLNAEAVDRYGDKQGLSLALARVVADQVRDALGLRRDQVTYEGKGDKDAIAVNSTARGRALNRRIDVTLWYDAPQDILSISDPQVCPVDGGPGMISERYLPDGQNPVTPVQYQNGKPVINDADVKQLQSLLTQLADKPNLHIVFAGYTDKSLLNRRGAMAYGDNWGLAEARAKQVKTLLQSKLDLPASKMSYEGKGFADNVAADQGEVLASVDGYVDIEVWFDVPAPVDENVVAELRHIEQKTDPVNPFTLAPLRITVDGKRLDASLPNTADVQRCTDVALAKTKIKLNYDDSTVEPRLNVSASSASIAREDKPGTDEVENRVRFQGYTNYPAMIKKAEVRLFRLSQAPGDTPLAVVPLNDQWQGSWQAGQNTPDELKYVLRVYGKNNQYDETRSKRLHVVLAADALPAASDTELMSRAYGENTLVRQEIPLRGGTITVKADEVPPGHQVWIMNQRAPMDSKGNLVTQQIIPKGLHTVEVAVLDDGGNGQVYLRDLDLDSRDWFYTGIADVTAGMDLTTGQAATVTGDTTHFNNSMFTDGRLAFYVKGSTKKDLEVTASMDTKEGSLDSLFTDIAKRDPQTLFRRLDSDYENYVYPTFGDDSKTREDAPTQGKIYVKLKKNNNFAMWGNFKAEWLDTDLARIDRGLYGAYGHYESAGATSFGARQTRLDSYVAQPGTVRAREEFRGTGGSLYYLRQRDITQGAESVWVEVRDSVSGIVLKTNRLVAGQDYTIDPLQGRIQLTQPLSSTADDSQLIKAGSLSGYPVFLVVHYEYIPDLNQVDNSSVALRGSHWLGDKVKLGFTYSDDQQVGAAQTLGAVDITLRKTAGTYVKLESAQSTGPGTGEYQSTDGGYFFSQVPQDTSANVSAAANRVETSVDLKDFMKETRGKFNTYFQQVEGGFSGQGQLAATDTTQYGANLNLPFGDTSDFNIKLDTKEVDMGLHTSVASVDYGHKLNKNWKLTTGIRNDYRDDQSLVVPTTQTEGTRTDGAVRMTYESEEGWKAFGYAQATLAKDGTRDGNNRLGTGGEYQVSKRLRLYGEISNGDLGLGAKAGANYMLN
ncbi:MAG: isopeptide-forming domain-containing fimbrial protein, partial [Acidiferrobacterales bacterium]